MKKAISFVVVLVLCLSLFGCGSENETPEITATSHLTNESLTASSGETEPADHTLKSETIAHDETEPTVEASWELDYLVDDFGDQTEFAYLRGVTEGTFSNTATAGSELTVAIFMNPAVSNKQMISSFAFRLLEYDKTPATYLTSDKLVIKVKIGDTIYEDMLTGTAPNGDLLIMNGANHSSEVYKQIYNTLLKEENVRCVIEVGSSKYSFTVMGTGFVSAANDMMKTYGYDSFDVSKWPVN